DVERLCWQCPVAAVREAAMVDDVVRLMVGRIERLEPGAQRLLQVAACVGARFEVEELARVRALRPAEIEALLDPATLLGLIVPETGTGRYSFVHDRVQQAAYSMLEAETVREVRLLLGRAQLAASKDPERDELLFDMLAHFDPSLDLVEGGER